MDVSQTEEKKEVQPKAEDKVEKDNKTETTKIPGQTPIEKVEATLIKIEAAEERVKKVTQEFKQAADRMMLSGKAQAGEQFKTPEQTAKEKQDAEIEATVHKFD